MREGQGRRHRVRAPSRPVLLGGSLSLALEKNGDRCVHDREAVGAPECGSLGPAAAVFSLSVWPSRRKPGPQLLPSFQGFRFEGRAF